MGIEYPPTPPVWTLPSDPSPERGLSDTQIRQWSTLDREAAVGRKTKPGVTVSAVETMDGETCEPILVTEETGPYPTPAHSPCVPPLAQRNHRVPDQPPVLRS